MVRSDSEGLGRLGIVRALTEASAVAVEAFLESVRRLPSDLDPTS